MNVQHKSIVVTGGGNGMGRELVLGLLNRGASVVAVDLNEKALEETAQLAANPKLSVRVLDIADNDAVLAFKETILAEHGALDGLINSAGIIQPFVRVNDLDDAAIERVMNINFFGTLRMTKALLPHFLGRPEAHVVNISSMGGFLPVPGQTIYGASKAAVKLLTEGLHSELSGTHVRVTVVFPGAIGTNIAQNSGVQISMPANEGKASAMKPLEPKKAAQIILDGMEKNLFRVLVGQDATFLDVFYRLNPRAAAAFIAKQMRALLSG